MKQPLLLLALLCQTTTALALELGSQQFSVNGSSVDYLTFSLPDATTVDIATSSSGIDPEVFLFSGTVESGFNNLIANDDDSCLSIDCGLVNGKYQFNSLINDISLEPGDYTIALGANDLQEDEAKNGTNLNTPLTNSAESDVLLAVGDENLIIAGTGEGSISPQLKNFASNPVIDTSIIEGVPITTADDSIDTGSNQVNTAVSIVDVCSSNPENPTCTELKDATVAQQKAAVISINPDKVNAVASSSVATNSNSTGGITTRLTAIKSGYVGGLNIAGINVSGGGASADSKTSIADNFGLFVNVNGGFGDREKTSNEAGYGFQSAGFTIGLDSAITDNFILGLAFNYSNTENNFINKGGKLTSDSYTGSIFASYYIDNFYIDAIGSIGTTDYSSERNINYTTNTSQFNAKAQGTNSAMQYLTSINIGYNYNFKSLLITPRIGVNYSKTNVDAYNETGAGVWDVAYQSHGIESLYTTVGASLSHVFSLPWAVVTPQVHGSWMHEFSYDAQNNKVSFVNNLSNTFIIRGDLPDRDYGMVGLNVAAQFAHGLSGFISYDSILGRSNISNHMFSGGVRFAF